MAGAKQILMENFSENADLLDLLREHTWDNATLESTVMKDKDEEGIKFKIILNTKKTLPKFLRIVP